jgi:nucleotidyltransferase/DNA polymerase involved in DNA repair
MPRIILHVDMDSFYAACETRENPSLKGKPLLIYIGTGLSGKGMGRAVVSTASYEARKYGCRSGMSLSQARRKCPQATLVLANFALYEAVSEKIMAIFRKHADAVEVGGIDEAYLDVSSSGSYAKAEKIAADIKADVLKKERLTCSVGIGPNKLVAKMASDFQKPDGLTVIKPDKVQEFLDKFPVRKLFGIGPKTEQKLKENFEAETVEQLRKISKKDLVETFGNSYGQYLFDSARGIDDSSLEENPVPKSFGREVTFEKDASDTIELESALDILSKDVHKMLTNAGFKYRTVTLVIRYENFEQHTAAKSLDEPTNDIQPILSISKELLRPFLDSGLKVRKIGVRVSSFGEKPGKKKNIKTLKEV